MSHTHCAVQGCKISIYNKPLGIYFHPCPSSNEMRNKWLLALKNKCALLDWTKSRICSKHFESKYFDSQRKLRDNAIPTLFPKLNKFVKYSESKEYVDKLLNKVTQTELIEDIRCSLTKVIEPVNFTKMITEELKCKPEASTEAQLWLLVKKQNHLNTRLLALVSHDKRQVDVLQKNVDETTSSKQDMNQNIETYKYIVKCLQEKLATLEEQIEILTAVESR